MLKNIPDNSLILEGSKIIGKSHSAHTKEIALVDNSIKLGMQMLANKIKQDVEKTLNTTFDMFDVFEYSASSNRLNHTQYNMTIQIGKEGYISIRISATDPDETWSIYIDEYEKGGTESQQKSTFKPSTNPASRSRDLRTLDFALKNEVQSIADYSMAGVELIIGKVFTVFEVLEYIALSALGVHYYHLRIVTDNNSSVKLRLSHDILEKSWNIQLEDYDKGDVIEQVKKEDREAVLGEEPLESLEAGKMVIDEA